MWMRIATSLMFSLLALACNAAPWEVVKQVDAMTDEARVSAMTINEDGASLSVYKVRDGSVWANFTLPRSSAKELQSLIGRIVNALDAAKQLPETVELKAVETVQNPFA